MANGNRIAKNTLILYVRMLFLMVVSLYTSRVVLQALGFSDFGTYNVVGGIIVVIGFLTGTLNTASSRYINVALAKGDDEANQRIFTNVVLVNLLLCVIICLLGETIGLWFLKNKLNIAEDRQEAAFWVYQASIFTAVFHVISVPFTAVIIAHERMKAFAYISIFDALLKLLMAISLKYISFDRLIFYAFFLGLLQVTNSIINIVYCRIKFPDARLTKSVDKRTLLEMSGFIGWSSYGSLVSVGFTQGLNILLNIFFGPVVNAARGVAVQVQNQVVAFTQNFQMAVMPQLMQSVAKGNDEDAQKLLVSSSKISFFLLCAIGIPLILEADFILSLWLGRVPDNAVVFVQLMLVISIWGSLANPLRYVNQAEGHIKKFQIYECTMLLFIVPVSYFVIMKWRAPYLVFVVHLIVEIIAQQIRLYIVLPKIGMRIRSYINKVYGRILLVFMLPLIVGYYLKLFLCSAFLSFFLTVLMSECIILILIWYIGMNLQERNFVCKAIKSKYIH